MNIYVIASVSEAIQGINLWLWIATSAFLLRLSYAGQIGLLAMTT